MLYKLFTRIITQRLTTKLDTYQPREQEGFRRGYSTMNHILYNENNNGKGKLVQHNTMGSNDKL